MYKGYPFSKTTYYRRKKKAEALGCDIMDVPDNRGKNKNHPSGSNHPKWNNNLMDSQGYRLVRVGVDHPLSDPNGYIREHVLVIHASQTPGAFLLERHPDKYVIHHRNGDKLDNRIENLQVISRADHNRLHNQDKDRNEKGQFVGKKAAGRLLDGREWNEFPEEAPIET